MKKRLLFTLAGLLYAVLFTAWGLIISGGGHFNLPALMAISPSPIGIFVWPALAFLSVDLSSIASRAGFVLLIFAHYVSLGIYIYSQGQDDLHWFRIGMQDPVFIVFPLVSVFIYAAGQIFLWRRFLQAARSSG